MVPGDDQQQTADWPTEGHIKETPGIRLVRKCFGIAGHENDTVALKAFRLVDRADCFRRRFRPGVGPAVRDLGKARVDRVELAQTHGIPKFFLVVHFDVGEHGIALLQV